jgi:hypothetical protein
LNRLEFARVLQRAVVGAFIDFRKQVPDEVPYAFTLILGQAGNYLGYAVATEQGLRRVASRYAALGYRYQGWEWEEFDNIEQLSKWLHWGNPDDGWYYGDFPDRFEVSVALAALVESRAFGEEADQLEEFCTDVMGCLQTDAEWLAVKIDRLVVGVTYGCDPRDFLRTATRANEFNAVSQLWQEFCLGEDLSSRISNKD